MKFITVIFCLIIFSFSLFAQSADEVLATANGQKFTAKVFPANVAEAYTNLPKLIVEQREQFLQRQIENTLLKTEAGAKNVSVEKLIEKEILAKVPAPTEQQVKAIYEANRASIGDKTLEEIRPQIVRFLRQKPEQTAYSNYISVLKKKYKITAGKNVNSPNLKSSDVLATVNGKQITLEDFEAENKSKLYDVEAGLYDKFIEELKQAIYLELVKTEAAAQKIEVSDLIAKEITNKMTDFSDIERAKLQNAFAKRLFEKYDTKILLEEPEPFVQKIDVANEPFQGPANAPVTVVMFTDFQCPACAATYPVLRKVIFEFGDKVRFVVRDFPLVNNHENAFNAAVAANAANAQGKFFEYKEILYQNQDQLEKNFLVEYASKIGLNIEKFIADLENQKFAEEVREDMKDGEKYGVRGTPTIFVNGVKVRSLSAENFRNVIEKSLE